MHRIVILFFLIIFITPSSANDDFWGLLDNISNYSDSVPNYSIESLSPDTTTQSYEHIKSWVDVVGYDKMVLDEGTYYVPDNPAKQAIVMYNAWYDLGDCYGHAPKCGVYSFTKNLSVYTSGNHTVAALRVELFWWFTNCGISCLLNERLESITFYDNEPSPNAYNSSASVEIYETIYNVSVTPETVLKITTSPVVTKYHLTTENGSITKWLRVGHVEYTPKRVPYLNMTRYDFIDQQGKGITPSGEEIILSGASENYSISFYSPFERLNITPIVHRTILENKISYPMLWHTVSYALFLGFNFFTLRKLIKLAVN